MRNRLAVLMALLAAPACAAPALTVSGAWMRAMPSAVPSGGYFTLHNNGPTDVDLIDAESPACGMLMLHRSTDTGGMNGMNDVADVKIPAGGSIAFSPRGLHLMCMDATAALKPGGTVPVTLLFDRGVKLTVSFAVRNAAGK